jgi:hypothetical protein
MSRALEIQGIACSVFQPEIEFLVRRGEIQAPASFVDSRLHMQPALLKTILRSHLDGLLKTCRGIVLFFGDCHPQMHHMCSDQRIARLDGINCGMILLGRQYYRELMHERAFLIFPEWAARWRDILLELRTSCGETGLHLFRDTHQKLAYLDTGTGPLPETELEACSSYLNLPLEIVPVPLDHFRELIRRAAAQLDRPTE